MSEATASRTVDVALLVLLSFLWGASFTLIEVAVETVPPATIVFLRLMLGAALLVVFALSLGHPFPRTVAAWGALSIQGILQSALPFSLITWGQQYIDSGLAGLLNTTPPLFAFLIGFFLLGDRTAGLRRFLGILIGFAGVFAIMGPAAVAGDGGPLLGQAAVTGASLSYALAAHYAKRFAQQSPVVTVASSMSLAAALMLPVSLAVDRPFDLSPTPEAVLAILGLGVFSTAVAMALYFRLVRALGPLGVTTGSYLRAGFSVILGVALLGEVFTPSHFVGLVLIFLGVAVVTGVFRRNCAVPRR